MQLFIHAGHDKTGSSYIQSALANSIDPLRSAGFTYPTDRKVQRAAQGKISSGNGGLFFETELSKLAGLEDNILISSEKLFRFLPEPGWRLSLRERCEHLNIDRVRVLLFVRNPIEHLASAYQQAVKRGGYTGRIETFADSYNHTKKVWQFVEYCEEAEFDLEIRNYSEHKSDLLRCFEAWLGVAGGTLVSPPVAIVNRSLTQGELEFQRIANAHLGKEASLLADTLCEDFPDIRSEVVALSPDFQQRVIERVRPYCDKVNEVALRIHGKEDAYRLAPISSPEPQKTFSFTTGQIESICRVFSSRFNRDK